MAEAFFYGTVARSLAEHEGHGVVVELGIVISYALFRGYSIDGLEAGVGSDEGRKESAYGICGLPIDYVVIWELVEDEEESNKGDEM